MEATTVRYFFTCRNCGHLWARDYTQVGYSKTRNDAEGKEIHMSDDYVCACPNCNMAPDGFHCHKTHPLKKRVYSAKHKCNASCTNATTGSCTCSCGGANHGSAYLH